MGATNPKTTAQANRIDPHIRMALKRYLGDKLQSIRPHSRGDDAAVAVVRTSLGKTERRCIEKEGLSAGSIFPVNDDEIEFCVWSE